MIAFNRFTLTGALASMATVLVLSPAFAQQPQPAPKPAPAPELRMDQPAKASTIEGELLRVDAEKQTLVVKTDNGKEEQLRYTGATKVTGGQSGVAGLANARGTQVSVRFTGSGADRVATDITIHEKG